MRAHTTPRLRAYTPPLPLAPRHHLLFPATAARRWHWRLRRFVLALLGWLLATSTQPASALTYLAIDDAELADQASVIAEIDVLSAAPAAGTAAPATDYVVLVDRVLKGTLDATAVIRVLGGETARGLTLAIAGAPAFREGDRALVFLAPAADGTFAILHFALGAFHRIETGATAALAVRDLRDATGFSRRGGAPEAVAEPARDYERFADWLGDRARGRRRELDYLVVPGVEAHRSIVERFTLLDDAGLNFRWFEFDGGGTVGWGFNGEGSDNPARDRDAFLAGLAAWNDDPGSGVAYTFLGDGAPDTFPESDGGNGVVFGDPNDEIEGSFDCDEGGTVAIGGVLFDGSTGRFGGVRYLRILEAGVVMQDGIECALAGNPPLSAEILTHELGHTLGIGHSCGDDAHCGRPVLDDAIMRAEVHDDGRGARLGRDDQRAVALLYPGGGGGGGGTGGGGGGLAVPTGVAAEALSPTSARVTWQDNSNERRFRVQFATGRRFLDAGVVGADTTELVVGGLPAGATVRFRVAAERRGASSGFSEVATVTLP